MKKRKILKGWLKLVFLAVLAISCSNSNDPGSSPDDTPEETTELPYKKVDTKTINGITYDIVTFGSFPQTEKAASVTIDGSEPKQNGIYTYYRGSDGQWYGEYDYQQSSDTYQGYCKVEPVKWRVLTDNYDHDNNPATPGVKLLLAEMILDNVNFYDNQVTRTAGAASVYPDNYNYSSIRAFLNGLSYKYKSSSSSEQTERTVYSGKGFLQMAFTADEEKYIVKSGSTEDKIFLLSKDEVSNSAYGFSDNASRIKITTTFGDPCEPNENEADYWWLRSSPEVNNTLHNSADIVDSDGSLTSMGVEGDSIFTCYWGGLVPALCIF